MKFCFAGETVLLLAARASISSEVIFIGEDGLAARSRTPVGIFAIFVYEFVQTELIVLLEQLPGDILLEVDDDDFGIASCFWARNGKLLICHPLLKVLN